MVFFVSFLLRKESFMQQKIALNAHGRGQRLLALATLLLVPVVAIAWLSPGLATAAGSPGIDGLLAFDSPTTMVVLANQQAEEAALAKDWAYTADKPYTKEEKKDFKELQKDDKKDFKQTDPTKDEKKDFKECQKEQKSNFKQNGPPASPANCP
jgi:hypothetical protein